MELDETLLSCFQSGAEDKPTFSLEVRQLYCGGHLRNPARKHRWCATCLAHPNGAY
jgi:hypothetical protein